MSSGGSFLPFEAGTSRPAEQKAAGAGSSNFASGSLGVLRRGATPVPSPDSWTSDSWLWEKCPHIVNAEAEPIQPPGEPCASHLAGSATSLVP